MGDGPDDGTERGGRNRAAAADLGPLQPGRSPSASGAPSELGIVHVYAADELAIASRAVPAAPVDALLCEACDTPIASPDDAERGEFVWTRGDDRRADPSALCPSCATAVGLSMRRRWQIEDDEEG